MTAQVALPGIEARPTVNDSDLRGEVALAIMALLSWAEFHGGRTALIDDTVERFVTAGTGDPAITRSLDKLRSMLANYVKRGGHVPSWFPSSLLKVIGSPCCARDLRPQSIPETQQSTHSPMTE